MSFSTTSSYCLLGEYNMTLQNAELYIQQQKTCHDADVVKIPYSVYQMAFLLNKKKQQENQNRLLNLFSSKSLPCSHESSSPPS